MKRYEPMPITRIPPPDEEEHLLRLFEGRGMTETERHTGNGIASGIARVYDAGRDSRQAECDRLYDAAAEHIARAGTAEARLATLHAQVEALPSDTWGRDTKMLRRDAVLALLRGET